MSKFKNVFYFLILGIVLFWLYYFITNKERVKQKRVENCENYRNEEFTGTIDSVYERFKLRCFTLEADSTEHSMWYFGNVYLEKNDSIVKKQGESEYIVYKRNYLDSVLVLKFDCNKIK